MPKAQKTKSKVISPLSKVSGFHFEMDRISKGFSLICSGVGAVTEFSENEVSLRLSGFSLLIFGKDLCITVFEGKTVEICGKISEVKLVYGKA